MKSHILATAAFIRNECAQTQPKRQDPVGAFWCPRQESNLRRRDFQSHALPTELPRHITRQVAALPHGIGFTRRCSAAHLLLYLPFGTDNRTWTYDLQIKNLLLFPLSYTRIIKAHLSLTRYWISPQRAGIHTNNCCSRLFFFRSPFTRHFCVQAIIIRIKPLLFVSPVELTRMAVFRSVPSDGLLKVFIVCHSRPQDAVFRFTSEKGLFLLHRHYKYYVGCLHLQVKFPHTLYFGWNRF